jgi:eukaryotic-like serine/threonine-protein kinase
VSQQTGRNWFLTRVLLPQVAADERTVKRFLLEMANNRILKHPNVVRLRDAGYSRGAFFMTLDYCDGGSVAGLMQQRGGTLPLDEAVEITLQALEGLHYAHNVFGPGRGLVHRDLKPANLFLSGSGSARVARVGDYGLAKAFDEAGLSGNTRTGEAAGTPYFLPRQQVIEFKYAEPEVDVWAMAASLYNMLTGFVPRDFPEGRDPWLVVLEEPTVPILKRPLGEGKQRIKKELAAVIDQALREEPEIGFPTAAAFKEALEDAL